MDWHFLFDFSNDTEPDLSGSIVLEAPRQYVSGDGLAYGRRNGLLKLQNGSVLDIALYHNPFTEAFFYLSKVNLTNQMFELFGLPLNKFTSSQCIQLPGQFIIGSNRTQLVHKGVQGLFEAPFWKNQIEGALLDEMVVFPIVREGAKFGIVDAISNLYDWIVDEVLVDAHHVYDSQIPGYGRRTRIAVFKDNDLNAAQRRAMKTAIVGDSIASGTVLISVADALRARYENLAQIEVIAPFAALRGLARMAGNLPDGISIRVHAFESLLNALAPDFYWSAHYAELKFHFDPELERRYRAWWGMDDAGNWIADTACAGYGWSEAFFNPRKHLRMINEQLAERHNLSIAQIIERSLAYAGE